MKNKILALILLGMSVFMMKFNFNYFVYDYRPLEGDTFWEFLGEEVFEGNYKKAYLSMRYMRYTNSFPDSFDPDYIQANSSKSTEDGDLLKVRNGMISIIQSNSEYRLPPTQILRDDSLSTYNDHLVTYNLFIALVAFSIGFLYVKADVKKFLKAYSSILLSCFMAVLSFFASTHFIFVFEELISTYVWDNNLFTSGLLFAALVLLLLLIWRVHKSKEKHEYILALVVPATLPLFFLPTLLLGFTDIILPISVIFIIPIWYISSISVLNMYGLLFVPLITITAVSFMIMREKTDNEVDQQQYLLMAGLYLVYLLIFLIY